MAVCSKLKRAVSRLGMYVAPPCLEWSALGDSPSFAVLSNDAAPMLTDEYLYTDEQNVPLFRVLRYEPKTFRQQRWNGSSWDSTLGDARRVLYRLPGLLAGVNAPQWVFIVEGEKDADRLIAEGFTATTIAMGANPGNWDKTETSVLDGAYVTVIGDNDAPGRRYARHVADSLSVRAAEVRLVRLDGLTDNGDTSDWFDLGGTPNQFAALVNSTPAHKPPRRKFGGVKPDMTIGSISMYAADGLLGWAREPVRWRVRSVLIEGTNLVVGGPKKALKSTLVSAEMAVAVANGIPWLDHGEFAIDAQAPVLVVLNEGVKPYLRTLDRIIQRHGLDSVGDIHVVEANGFTMDDDDLTAIITDGAQEIGAGMIIYDAWYGFVGADAEAANLFAMRKVFGVVQSVAEDSGSDAVIVHHFVKHSRGRPELDTLSFAGIAEWADSWILLMHREIARPEEGEYRLGLVAGSRQWGELTYELDGSFGRVDIEHGGYTEPPRWLVSKVDSEISDGWGKTSGKPTVDPEMGLTGFIAAHPYEFTQSALCQQAPGGDQRNRAALKRMIRNGTVTVRYLKRTESNGVRKSRHLLALDGTDPATTEQQRLAPIGNDLPTNVAQHGAGNSPEAAVSAPSELQLDGNLGRTAKVENTDTPTLFESTSASDLVPDQGSEITPRTVDVQDLPEPEDLPQCDKCGELHEPPLPGEINWKCFYISIERDQAKQARSF